MSLPPHKLIRTNADWQSCLDQLQRQPRLAIDLEANSLYAYREQVCLIQITIPEKDYIIDPVAILELDGLGRIIQDPDVEKIFHAAEYDLILLKRQYGWVLNNLFDTMWAARILGYDRCGLANLLEEAYGVKVNKRYQKANWCARPLKDNMLSYAQTDTHYLPQLRDALAAELSAAGRMVEALEIFSEQTRVNVNNNHFDPDSFWSISGVNTMSRRKQAIVRALHIYRDQQARKQNRPLFKIFSDRTLLELAEAEPSHENQLPAIFGMSKGQIRRYGRQLLRVIQLAKNDPLPKKPGNRDNRPSDAVVGRYEKLHNWRKERALARGVESDVIISRDTLWALAHANPRSEKELKTIDNMGPWRREAYGEEILRVLGTTGRR